VIAICIGACLGALARWQLGLWLNPSTAEEGIFPWGTLAANLIGGLTIHGAVKLPAMGSGSGGDKIKPLGPAALAELAAMHQFPEQLWAVIIDEVGEAEADDWGDVAIGATGRSQADAPEIDGAVYLRNVPATLKAGDIVDVTVEDADPHDLFGVIAR
jgi:hypothetical protein